MADKEMIMTDDEKVFFDLARRVAVLGNPRVSEILMRHGYTVEADCVSLMEESCPKNSKTDAINDSDKVVYSNPWFQIIKNGRYHYMREKNARQSAVIIAERDDCYLFVRQYRYSLKKDMLELPRGSAKDSETSVDCAVRELMEESGLVINAEDVIKLGTVCPNSGVMASDVGVFFAKVESDQKPINTHADGIKEAVFIQKNKVLDMIRANEITDAFSLAALMMVYVRR